MAGVKALVGLAFLASIGVTFLILACALKEYNCWWPMFVFTFYVLAPLPCTIARRYRDSVETSSALWEMCLFFTAGIVVSAFGLVIVLAHTAVIKWGACGLVMAGNTVVFCTILGFFYIFSSEDDFSYSGW